MWTEMDWCCDLNPHNTRHARLGPANDWLRRAAGASLEHSKLNMYFSTYGAELVLQNGLIQGYCSRLASRRWAVRISGRLRSAGSPDYSLTK
jgi:hypothetical protein